MVLVQRYEEYNTVLYHNLIDILMAINKQSSIRLMSMRILNTSPACYEGFWNPQIEISMWEQFLIP
jgi:hypothetical protein